LLGEIIELNFKPRALNNVLYLIETGALRDFREYRNTGLLYNC